MGLSRASVKSAIYAKGYEVFNIEEYKSMDSLLDMKCPEGHSIRVSFKDFRRESFLCPSCEQDHGNIGSRSGYAEVEKKIGYRIVSIDQATGIAGLAVFDDGLLVHAEAIIIGGDLTIKRLANLHRLIVDICDKLDPDYIIFEDIQLQSQGYKTFKVLAEALGICTVAAEINGVKSARVFNKVWQSYFGIAGKGRGEQKANVIKKVEEYYKERVSDDIADAILLGRYAVSQLSDEIKGIETLTKRF